MSLLRRTALSSSLLAVIGFAVLAPAALAGMHPQLAAHTRANGTILARLGTRYTKKGCTTASEMTLEHLESTPGKYSVWINTKGHPGDLRGTLFAGMAHM